MKKFCYRVTIVLTIHFQAQLADYSLRSNQPMKTLDSPDVLPNDLQAIFIFPYRTGTICFYSEFFTSKVGIKRGTRKAKNKTQ